MTEQMLHLHNILGTQNLIYQTTAVTCQVTFPKTPQNVKTLEGVVSCAVGDAVVTGPQGESWPVPREAFFLKYAPLPGVTLGADGQYIKRRAFVQARQLDHVETLTLSDGRGTLTGQAGDWCITYGLNNAAFIRSDIFAKSYTSGKSVPVHIGCDPALMDIDAEKLSALEAALKVALPNTPIIFLALRAVDATPSTLWCYIAAKAVPESERNLGEPCVLALEELIAPTGGDYFLGCIERLQNQTWLSFTTQRFGNLMVSLLKSPKDVGEAAIVAAQLVAVDDFNAALQAGVMSPYFLTPMQEELSSYANENLYRVGAVADQLAGNFQKKWQELLLAETKTIEKIKSQFLPLKILAALWLLLGVSIVALGLIAALGLASFSELAEGCEAGDWFAWTGCTTEFWKHWVGFSAFAFYLGALVIAWLRFAKAKVVGYEKKHQDYRLLAECLRVQYVVGALGESRCVANDFLVGKNAESSWVLMAIRALMDDSRTQPIASSDADKANEWVMDNFVKVQTNYHEKTLITRREHAIEVLSAIGRLGAGFFIVCLLLLTANVLSKLQQHEHAIFSPMGQHLLLIVQVVGLAVWGSMRKVIDTFALEQEVQRGVVVLDALAKASKGHHTMLAAAQLFAKDQWDWHALHRGKPVEATTGGG